MKSSTFGITGFFSSLISSLALSFSVFAQQAPATAPAAAPATPQATAPATAPVPASKPAAAPTAVSADGLEGKIAHYGRKFDGRTTACGMKFSSNGMTMAHKTLPCGTVVKVTNLKNKKSVIVKVTDRGPSTPDRIADVTTAAARKLGMTKAGVIEAKLEIRKAGGKMAKAKKAMKKVAKK